MDIIRALKHLLAVSLVLLLDIVRFLILSVRSATALRAENLFLRRQLALYAERKIKARRADDGTRFVFVLLSRVFTWKDALVIVRPETLIRWHRKGFRLFWRWKSKRRGRPQLRMEIQRVIVQMAEQNVTWGEERIAAELLLKLGVRVSPRTVRRYMPRGAGTGNRVQSQQWTTFVRNHAKAIMACDFFVAVTATFRMLYVLVIMEVGTRRIIHFNVTEHPTSKWTLQQFREAIHGEEGNRFLIHDRDSIYSTDLDSAVESTGLKILKTPVRAPTANAYCERLIGTIRRECLDFMIPLNERHLRHLLAEWVTHYNRGRPHSSLGPGIPDPSVAVLAAGPSRHEIPRDCRVVARPLLCGLHHEYRLAKLAA
jgi:transposase InsO family protein